MKLGGGGGKGGRKITLYWYCLTNYKLVVMLGPKHHKMRELAPVIVFIRQK
jgi:hypothetical protein